MNDEARSLELVIEVTQTMKCTEIGELIATYNIPCRYFPFWIFPNSYSAVGLLFPSIEDKYHFLFRL